MRVGQRPPPVSAGHSTGAPQRLSSLLTGGVRGPRRPCTSVSPYRVRAGASRHPFPTARAPSCPCASRRYLGYLSRLSSRFQRFSHAFYRDTQSAASAPCTLLVPRLPSPVVAPCPNQQVGSARKQTLQVGPRCCLKPHAGWTSQVAQVHWCTGRLACTGLHIAITTTRRYSVHLFNLSQHGTLTRLSRAVAGQRRRFSLASFSPAPMQPLRCSSSLRLQPRPSQSTTYLWRPLTTPLRLCVLAGYPCLHHA